MQATYIVRVPISKLEGFCQNEAEQKILDDYRQWRKTSKNSLCKNTYWPGGGFTPTRVWFFAEPGVQFVVFVYVHSGPGYNNRLLEAVRKEHTERGADKVEDAREGVLMSEQVRDFFAGK